MRNSLIFLFLFSVLGFSAKAQDFLYGLTAEGGPDNFGVIFRTDEDGTNQEVIYEFPYLNRGKEPTGALLEASNGKIYGLTARGGKFGSGVLYQYLPESKSTEDLFRFSSNVSGSIPVGGLIENNGVLYGVTSFGGDFSSGVLYKYDLTSNTFTKLHDFRRPDHGRKPAGSLVFKDDKLYGVTQEGGSNNDGTLFEFNISDSLFTKKVDFSGSGTGAEPIGELLLRAGKLYGMTSLGGQDNRGVIFEYNTITDLFVTKLSFEYLANGSYPYGSLLDIEGKFYGMASDGGANDMGVLFQFDPISNDFVKLLDFNGQENGAFPQSSLIVKDSVLYGYTGFGGENNKGVIFNYSLKDSSYTKGYDLKLEDGSMPRSKFTVLEDKFIGFSTNGGSSSSGTLFEFDFSDSSFTEQLGFDLKINGYNPRGSLLHLNDKLYGMTTRGGAHDLGVLFEFDTQTNEFSKQVDFDGLNGANPYGALIEKDGQLLGLTERGGASNDGVLFEYNPMDSTFVKRSDFNESTTGARPRGTLVAFDGKFYGTTLIGGGTFNGVLFEYDPNVKSISVKAKFDRNNTGSSPTGSLVAFGGKLYGLAPEGGSNGRGVLFEYDVANNTLSKKIDFTGAANGGFPNGSLILHDGVLYGMTSEGGANNFGVIFAYGPSNNSFVNKFNFSNTATGIFPFGSLVTNGTSLYGMTSAGGSDNGGVLFEFKPSENSITKKVDFIGENGRFPHFGHLVYTGDVVIGINEAFNQSARDLKAFPNPSQGKYTITNLANNTTIIEVTNTAGAVVNANLNWKDANTVTIDIQNFPTGMYFAKFQNSNNEQVVLKLIRM